jgi:hypothetical protein
VSANTADCELDSDEPLLSYGFAIVVSNRFSRSGIIEAFTRAVGVNNGDRGRRKRRWK